MMSTDELTDGSSQLLGVNRACFASRESTYISKDGTLVGVRYADEISLCSRKIEQLQILRHIAEVYIDHG